VLRGRDTKDFVQVNSKHSIFSWVMVSNQLSTTPRRHTGNWMCRFMLSWPRH
jgi:hypothetical protein